MKTYAENEIVEIMRSLLAKNFFNLSNENFKETVNLKSGKKYTPKTKFNVKLEIFKFNIEVGKILERFLLREFNFKTKIIRQT